MNKVIYTAIVSCLVVVVIIVILKLYFRTISTRISQKINNAYGSNYQNSDSYQDLDSSQNSTIKQTSNPKEVLMHAENFYKADLMYLLNLTKDQFDQFIITTYLSSQCDPWMILEAVKDSIATTLTKKHDETIIKEIKSQQTKQLKALNITDMETQNKLWLLPSILLFAEKIKLLDPKTTKDKTITGRMNEFKDDCIRRYLHSIPYIANPPKGFTSLAFADIAFLNIYSWMLKVIQKTVPNIKYKIKSI